MLPPHSPSLYYCLFLYPQIPLPYLSSLYSPGKHLLWLNPILCPLGQLSAHIRAPLMAGRKHTTMPTGFILNLWPQTSSEPLGLLGNRTLLKPPKPLSSALLLADQLASYFTEKIEAVIRDLPHLPTTQSILPASSPQVQPAFLKGG